MHSDGTERVYADGEIIMREGDAADGMFVIRSGAIDVFRTRDGHEVSLGRLREGEVLGEMALFDSKPRSASARAVGDTRVEFISREELKLRVSDPLVWKILQNMGARLREIDEAFGKLETAQASRQDVVASWSSRRAWTA